MPHSPSFALGFDTIIINVNSYDMETIKYLFDFFPKYSIRNFIFLFDYDFKIHSLSLQKEKMKNFILSVKALAPRGIHCSAHFNLLLDHSSTLNKVIVKLRANKLNGLIFVTLPQLDSENYNDYAKDINKLLYDNQLYPIFVEFDKFSVTSDNVICQKLFLNKNAIFAFDINFLLNPDNQPIIDKIFENDISILPMISSHYSKYAGIENIIKFYIERFGKQQYNKLCFKLGKSISKLF